MDHQYSHSRPTGSQRGHILSASKSKRLTRGSSTAPTLQHQRQEGERKLGVDKGATAAVSDAAVLPGSLLNWSEKQSHILTGGGVSSRCYRAPRFPFSNDELPHFHKANGSTHEAFALWHRQGTALGAEIAGAWKRPLFVGGWTHSDDAAIPRGGWEGEITFNLQTPSMFVDIRVPKAGVALLGHHRGFHTMTDLELRLFARRHAFAGYTRLEPLPPPTEILGATSTSGTNTGGRKQREAEQRSGLGGSVATRHHCIDWNYVGEPRPRPNKWRVEMGPGGDVWKEWGFAKDAFEQHVYMERWERLPGGRGPFFALRRRASSSPDALLVVCGDHFGLIVDRAPGLLEGGNSSRGGGGLVGLVDDAIVRGEREKAVAFLSLEASHGMVSAQDGRLAWTVDCSLHPWLEKRRPLSGSVLTVARDGLSVDWVSCSGSSSSSSSGSAGGSGSGAFSSQGSDGWNGTPLNGVWDVVETSMPLSSPSSSSSPLPRSYVPTLAFARVFAGSGAKVVLSTGAGEEGVVRRNVGGVGFPSPRAKL
ncbi:unnamed protein product [Pylaiella littoralis]